MPSMHDMIDELNDMDCPSFSASEPVGNNFLTTGCGFGSWIWILLILFYAGQGGTANTGCCCGGGYLFLLVILFLCNGTFGCGNNGFNTNCNGSLL